MAHLNVKRTELFGYTTFECFTRVKGVCVCVSMYVCVYIYIHICFVFLSIK